jgi:bifunctional non-homologous end joining protein LigD
VDVAKNLKEYLKKRQLKKSREPAAKIGKRKGELRFVVQKHAARRLHYDFRLEVDGVLKSWAVPKGPSVNPGQRRLAIEVEDHPLEYQNFEGVIPKGYGAGKVMIWDKGTYSVEGRGNSEKLAREGIKKGSLHFTLEGKKLHGDFALVRLKGRENQWLLIKRKDEYASSEDITEKDRSVISKRRLEEVGEERKNSKFLEEYSFLSNVDKVYWPKEKISKGQLLNYYVQIASVILTYLKDRPESLRRFPDGILGNTFFQKNLKDRPSWVETVAIKVHEKKVHYLLINDVRSLLYAVNLGCIELHPFFSRYQSLNNPDFLVFDLDPIDVSFDRVVETAQAIHEVLEEIAVPSYCKTSGGRGIHVCVPLQAKYSYKEAKYFALLIASIVHHDHPSFTSLERLPAKRRKKVYIDCFQNNPGQTIAAPYCVRAKPGAPVSMPLDWKEMEKGLNPLDFTIFNTLKRVEKKGDLFKAVLGKGAPLKEAIRKLEQKGFLEKQDS